MGASVFEQTLENDDNGVATFVGDQFSTTLKRDFRISVDFRSFSESGSALYNDPSQQSQGGLLSEQVDEFLLGTENSPLTYLVMLHPYGNNISRNSDLIVNGDGTYSGWSQFQIDEFRNELRLQITRLQDAGHTVVPTRATFRIYDANSEADGETEQDRSSVVHRELALPIYQELCAEFLDDSGECIINLWQASYDSHLAGRYFNGVFGAPNFDGIHPILTGIADLQVYLATTLRDNAEVFGIDPIPPKKIFTFTVNTSTLANRVLYNANRITGSGTISGLVDINGDIASGSQLVSANIGTPNLSGIPDGNSIASYAFAYNYEPTAKHYAAGTGRVFIDDVTTGMLDITLGPEYANTEAKAYVVGATNATDTRLTQFNFSSGTVVLNATAVPPQVGDIDLVLDQNGHTTVTFQVASNSPSDFGYFGTLTLEVDRAIVISGAGEISVVENQPSTQTYLISNAESQSLTITDSLGNDVSSIVQASLTQTQVENQSVLALPSIDYEQIREFIVSITAVSEFETVSREIPVFVQNILEQTIISPFEPDVIPSINTGENVTLSESTPEIAAWLAQSNATGVNISEVSESQILLTLTLEDAAPVSQLVNVTRVLAPIIEALDAFVESGKQLNHLVTIRRFDGIPEVTRGKIVKVDGPIWEWIIPAYDSRVTTEPAQLQLIADDGVNDPVIATITVTVTSSENQELIPDVVSTIFVKNVFSDRNDVFISPSRDNPIYLEFSQFDRVIDFSTAMRFQILDRRDDVLVDTDINSNAIMAAMIKDRSGRGTPSLRFNFSSVESNLPSSENLTLVVYDANHPQGQEFTHHSKQQLSFEFL